MKKKTIAILFICTAAAVPAAAQSTLQENKVEAVDTLSEEYKANFTIQQPPAAQTSRKVKYISGFSNDSVAAEPQPLKGNTTSAPQMETRASAELKNDTQPNTGSPENTDDDFATQYKTLKSQ